MRTLLCIIFLSSLSFSQTRFPLVVGQTHVQDHGDSTGKYRVVYQYGSVPADLTGTFTIDTLGARSEPTGADATVLVFKRQPNGSWKLVGNKKTLKWEHPVETIEKAKKE